MRVLAIGDIHGCLGPLDDLLAWVAPTPDDLVVTLGDYVDRGPHSKTVLDLLAVRLVANRAVCLRGNHEAVMEGFFQDPAILQYWQDLGGMQTLASYGVEPNDGTETEDDLHRRFLDVFPREHQLFMQCLRNQFSCGDFLFVHAGIRPGIPLEHQDANDLMWIRDLFLDSTQDHGRFIVHGHTPVPHPDIRHNRINIDTGAWRTGTLTCIAIEGSSILFL